MLMTTFNDDLIPMFNAIKSIAKRSASAHVFSYVNEDNELEWWGFAEIPGLIAAKQLPDGSWERVDIDFIPEDVAIMMWGYIGTRVSKSLMRQLEVTADSVEELRHTTLATMQNVSELREIIDVWDTNIVQGEVKRLSVTTNIH